MNGRQTDPRLASVMANEVRHARAELKRQIARGEISAAEVILSPSREAISWRLMDLLLSQRSWGQVKCRRFLTDNRLDGRKQLGGLTDRQRTLLAGQLPRLNAAQPASVSEQVASDREANAVGAHPSSLHADSPCQGASGDLRGTQLANSAT